MTMWHFDSPRNFIIEQIEAKFSQQDPVERIQLAEKCQVGRWIHPAYKILCERVESLSADEAGKLGIQRMVAICRIREGRIGGTIPMTGHSKACGHCKRCKRLTPHLCKKRARDVSEAIKAAQELENPFECDLAIEIGSD